MEVAATEAQQASRLNELEAFDRVITSAYPGVRRHAAGSIVTWAGAHGKRGDLKKFVLELLRTAAPRALRTGEVFAAVVVKFELRLTTREKAKVVDEMHARNVERERVWETMRSLARKLKSQRDLWA